MSEDSFRKYLPDDLLQKYLAGWRVVLRRLYLLVLEVLIFVPFLIFRELKLRSGVTAVAILGALYLIYLPFAYYKLAKSSGTLSTPFRRAFEIE